MTQETIGAGAARFEIGRVISTSLAVFTRNFVPFFVISLLIGIPYILVSFWMLGTVDVAAIEQTGQLPPGFWGMVVVGALVYLLTVVLIQATLVFGTVQDLRGQKASFGDCLARGLASLPRVAVGALLAGIAVAIGMMLLLVPGIILLVIWWVFVPAMVIEGASITASFGRSRDLTRGHRWGIFGLLLIVGVAQWVISLVVGLLGAALGPTGAEVLNIAIALVFSGFASVMSAVGYYYLRAEKEGIVIDDIAKVFD